MIVDFPKANFFMTTWGMRKYWVGQEESFVDVMARETVPLLVLNQELLDRNQMESARARELIDADASALREGFIPHGGPQIGSAHAELQSLMRISYAVFCLKKNRNSDTNNNYSHSPPQQL